MSEQRCSVYINILMTSCRKYLIGGYCMTAIFQQAILMIVTGTVSHVLGTYVLDVLKYKKDRH